MKSEDLQKLFTIARENGCPWIEVEGVRFPVPKATAAPSKVTEAPQLFTDPASAMSDEEVLFWSCPHYDEIQREKEDKKKHAEETRLTRG